MTNYDDSLLVVKTPEWKFQSGFIGDSIVVFHAVERLQEPSKEFSARQRDSITSAWLKVHRAEFFGRRFYLNGNDDFVFQQRISCGVGATSYQFTPFQFTSGAFEIYWSETPWEGVLSKHRCTYVILELSHKVMVWKRIPSVE